MSEETVETVEAKVDCIHTQDYCDWNLNGCLPARAEVPEESYWKTQIPDEKGAVSLVSVGVSGTTTTTPPIPIPVVTEEEEDEDEE